MREEHNKKELHLMVFNITKNPHPNEEKIQKTKTLHERRKQKTT